jgi:hypothetical protein
MNLRDRVSPYTTLHVKNMVLIIVKVHVGTRIFNRSLGHSCVPASAILNCNGVFQVKEERPRTKHDHSMVGIRKGFQVYSPTPLISRKRLHWVSTGERRLKSTGAERAKDGAKRPPRSISEGAFARDPLRNVRVRENPGCSSLVDLMRQ